MILHFLFSIDPFLALLTAVTIYFIFVIGFFAKMIEGKE